MTLETMTRLISLFFPAGFPAIGASAMLMMSPSVYNPTLA